MTQSALVVLLNLSFLYSDVCSSTTTVSSSSTNGWSSSRNTPKKTSTLRSALRTPWTRWRYHTRPCWKSLVSCPRSNAGQIRAKNWFRNKFSTSCRVPKVLVPRRRTFYRRPELSLGKKLFQIANKFVTRLFDCCLGNELVLASRKRETGDDVACKTRQTFSTISGALKIDILILPTYSHYIASLCL